MKPFYRSRHWLLPVLAIVLGLAALFGLAMWIQHVNETAPCEEFKNVTVQHVPLRCMPK